MRICALLSKPIIWSLVALISACSSGPKAFAIRGEGDQILNRDINGKSLSVVVHIYQLKDAQEFSKLTFDMVASGRPESELLGPALLDKIEAVVVPGGDYVSSEKFLDDTKFVGIVAFFRNPDPYYWRQLVDAETISKQGNIANRSSGFNFKVQDCFIMLTGAKAVPLPGQPIHSRPECGSTTPPGFRPSLRAASPGIQQSAKTSPTPNNFSAPR